MPTHHDVQDGEFLRPLSKGSSSGKLKTIQQPAPTAGAAISTVHVACTATAVSGLAVTWDDGTHHTHGRVEVEREGANDLMFKLAEGQGIGKMVVHCSTGLNSRVVAVAFHLNDGSVRQVSASAAGGAKEYAMDVPTGHVVVGFIGRVDGELVALGIQTLSAKRAKGRGPHTPHRGPVVGGPSGQSFSDLQITDHSQLNAVVLRTSFRVDTRPEVATEAHSLFEEIASFCTDGNGTRDAAKYNAMMKEAAAFFGVDVVRPNVHSPVHGTPKSTFKSSDPAVGNGVAFPLTFDPFAADFGLSQDGTTARCLVSAAWRSISSNVPLPLEASDAVVVHLGLDEIRTVAVGLYSGFVDELDSSWYVGSNATSVAMQSTGHTLHDAVLTKLPAPEARLIRGDRLTLFATRSALTFIKGKTRIASVSHSLKDPFLTVSIYLGPNAVSILGCTVLPKGSTPAADLESEAFQVGFGI